MKKTIIAMLALSGVAFGATADELNTNLASYLTLAGYEKGDEYTLSFVVTGVTGGSSNDVFSLAPTWNIFQQGNAYIGLNNPSINHDTNEGTKPMGAVWIPGGVTTDTYNGILTVGEEGWLTQQALNGATVTLTKNDILGTTLSIGRYDDEGQFVPTIAYFSITETDDLKVNLKTVDFMMAATTATLTIGNTEYNLTQAAPAIPEPTTATLSLLALAGLAARRRRK